MRPSAVLLLFLGACAEAPAPVAVLPEPAQPTVEYVSEQEILTPLPLRVRLPSRYQAERVLVFFQTWGSRDWKTLELGRVGQTWSGEVSCREVSTVTGDTRYYFLAVDAQDHPVIGSGWPEWPHVATVVHELPGGAKSLANTAPPARCYDVADCPPAFIGCPSYAWRRPACHVDDDCRGSARCDWDGYCSDGPSYVDGESDDARLAAAVKTALHKHRREVASFSAAR
jgi:hypothetical protein